MYFFYIDESGDKNPAVKPDEPFVMLSVCFHEYQWRKFEREINEVKISLLHRIYVEKKISLELADAEVHSRDIRIPKRRAQHPFLKHLTVDELKLLVDTMYGQLAPRHISIMATVMDKACLHSYMDTDKVTKKAYELLLERGESLLGTEHERQQALFILDNTSKQLNRSIAMKHSYFQKEGTSSGIRLRHIIEMPLFVESYLSNGVQLADLCAYNVFSAFRSQDEKHPFFLKILPYFYKSPLTEADKLDGLKVFPDNHRWKDFLDRVKNERARQSGLSI